MAISIISSPYRFSPSKNPVIWSVASNNLNINYFLINVFDGSGAQLISTLKIYPTPDNISGVFLDLSQILSSFSKWEFKDYNDVIIETFDRNIFGYKITITEKILSSGTIVDGSTYNSTSYYVFSSHLDKITFRSYNQILYVVNSTNKIRLMTTKPDFQTVNDYSNEGLYFIQDNYSKPIGAKYSFYDKSGTSIGNFQRTIEAGIQSSYKLFRLNISP